jgi:TDG/mug DNA glycosylase family protein
MALPDVIRPGLQVVFCGTAVSRKSSRLSAYYAGPGNQFWPILNRVGLTPQQLAPNEYVHLLDYGIGLTDLCKARSGSDRDVGTGSFDVPRLTALLEAHRPRILAFNGKAAAQAALGRKVDYGPQPEPLAGVLVFVLPSTSGAARRTWDEGRWRELAKACKPLARKGTTGLPEALDALRAFAGGTSPTGTIASIQTQLQEKTRRQVSNFLARQAITDDLLTSALLVKDMASQIDVTVHAVGILLSLPYILEPGERIELLSLGAGNTPGGHDLVTDMRIAEFKFTRWRGRDAGRQNHLFVDLFNLASADTDKLRCLYVVGIEAPLRFLEGRRSVASVLGKHATVATRFQRLHGEKYATVGDYYRSVADRVEIIDLGGCFRRRANSPAASCRSFIGSCSNATRRSSRGRAPSISTLIVPCVSCAS